MTTELGTALKSLADFDADNLVPAARREPGSESLRAKLETLAVNESHCMAVRLDQDEATSLLIESTQQRLHNTARGAITRANRNTGYRYTGERGVWHTDEGHHPVVCYLITRTV